MFKLLLPHFCVLCHKPSHREMDLCLACENQLPFLKNACHICASPLPENNTICGQCLTRKKPFDQTISIFKYEPPVSAMITGLKFSAKLHYATLFGKLLARKIIQKPELIIPIPLHKNRLKERGFNQSLEIAKQIGKQLNIPIDVKSCQRIIHTQPQAQIPAKDRKKNVQNAFGMVQKISTNHIAVIDDVVTTGHTISSFCQMLKQQGVQHIDVWCIAKTALR